MFSTAKRECEEKINKPSKALDSVPHFYLKSIFYFCLIGNISKVEQ